MPVSIMCARSVIGSSNALHKRGLGNTCVHSENGRFVVTINADSLGAFGDHLEQELRSDVGQRHVTTHFVEDNHVVAQPACQHSLHRVVLSRFHQLIDQVCGGGESRPPFLAARGYAQTCRQMRLTGTAFAHQHHRFSALNA